MKRFAVIVAGGKGLRMGKELPKQFIELDNLPVLMHTIRTFHNFDQGMGIYVVLPKEHIDFWENLCRKYSFDIEHSVVIGGKERFHSVKNGLSAVSTDSDGVVAVHDGVRPFISHEALDRLFNTAQEKGVAVPVIDSVNSVRIADEKGNRAIDRNSVKLVQTPQVFHLSKIREAFIQEFSVRFTDEAAVYEETGREIILVKGDEANIKITTPVDLLVAESLIKAKKI